MQHRIPPCVKGFLPPIASTLVVSLSLAFAATNAGWYGLDSSRQPASQERSVKNVAESGGLANDGELILHDDRTPVVLPRVGAIAPVKLNCSIVQAGIATDTLWWFGGADAAGYSERVTLTVLPVGQVLVPPLRWKIVRGQDKVSFPNGIDEIITPGNSVDVLSTGFSTPSATTVKDIRIVIRDARRQVCTYPLVVFAPAQLVLLSESHNPGTEGFISGIEYRTETQFNQVLPYQVELNSDWGDEVSDFPGENWIWRPERGVLVDPASWHDTIARNSASLFSMPLVQGPQFPLGSVAVDHRVGAWKHGTTVTQTGPNNNGGVTAKTLTWQIYQDHALHE